MPLCQCHSVDVRTDKIQESVGRLFRPDNRDRLIINHNEKPWLMGQSSVQRMWNCVNTIELERSLTCVHACDSHSTDYSHPLCSVFICPIHGNAFSNR